MKPLYDVNVGAIKDRGLTAMSHVSQTASRFDKERPGAPGKSVGGGIMAGLGGTATASALGASTTGAGLAGPWGLAAGAGIGLLAYGLS